MNVAPIIKPIKGLILVLVAGSLPVWGQVQVEKVLPLMSKKIKPSTLKLDAQKNLWIINLSNKNIQRLTDQGTLDVSIHPGTGKTTLYKDPSDFTFSDDGKIIVSDMGLGRVVVLISKSTDQDVGKKWKNPLIEYQFPVPKPSAIAISNDHIIAVGSEKEHAVKVYSIDGVPLHNLIPPKRSELKAITALQFSNDGQLWVLDSASGFLHRFSTSRKWLGKTNGLKGAQGLTVDDYGYAYVSLKKGRWVEINHEGKKIRKFGTKGKEPGKMKNPHGIAMLESDLLWVVDTGNKRLQLFKINNEEKLIPLLRDPSARVQVRRGKTIHASLRNALLKHNGELLLLHDKKSLFELQDKDGKKIREYRRKGKWESGYLKPISMDQDQNGTVWVLDQGDHLIKETTEDGNILKTFGEKGRKEGHIYKPTEFQIRKDGSFVIIDKSNTRIQVLSDQGLFLFTVGNRGEGKGQFEKISGLAVTDEKIAIVDNKRKAAIFYDDNGKFIKEIANKEDKTPIWAELTDIEADVDGRFYILDSGLNRVRIFNPDGQFLADFATSGKKLAFGPKRDLLVMGEKTAQIFSIYPVPNAVKDLKAEIIESDIKISWESNSESLKYNVYRATEIPYFTLLNATTHTFLNDSDTIPGSDYVYAVRGVNSLEYQGHWAQTPKIKGPKKKNVSLVSIGDIMFNPVFTAAYKYYSVEPIGTIQIRSNTNETLQDVKISLRLKRYSDFFTEKTIPKLEPGTVQEIPVTITFNDKILEVTEDTPAQVDIQASYFSDNEEKIVSKNAPLTIYSRNAISWKDKNRVASFITPKDPPVVEFTRVGIRSFLKPLKASTIGKPLAKAVLFYEAMNGLNISYVQDPLTPYATASNDPEILDFVQFPRETLRRKTGDCDDTSVLLAAMLESIGVETALVDTPGHIFVMANLEESDPNIIGFPEERFVEYRGTLWVPIETTKLGSDFTQAWQEGISKVNEGRDKNHLEFVPFSAAREKYAPVTLVEKDKKQPAFPVKALKDVFPKILNDLQKQAYEHKLNHINAQIRKDPANNMLRVQLGMVHVEGGAIDQGKEIFTKLIKDDEVEVQAAAYNNLGNISYLAGDYKAASKAYEDAAILSPDDGGIAINRARTAWKLNNKSAAKKFLLEAREYLPDWHQYATDIPSELKPK
jgi:hypothetical protein